MERFAYRTLAWQYLMRQILKVDICWDLSSLHRHLHIKMLDVRQPYQNVIQTPRGIVESKATELAVLFLMWCPK